MPARSVEIVYNTFKEFIRLTLVLLLLFIVCTVFELAYDIAEHGTPKLFGAVVFQSLVKDIAFFLTYSIILFIPFAIIHSFNKKGAKIFFIIFSVIFLLIQISLSKYFITTLLPLGGDFWGYSWEDIKTTVGASGALNFWTIFLFIIVIVGIIYAFKYLYPKVRIQELFSILALILCIGCLFFISSAVNEKWLPGQDEHSNNLSLNKSWYFYKQSFKAAFPPNEEMSIYSDNYFGEGTGPVSLTDSTSRADTAINTTNTTTTDNTSSNSTTPVIPVTNSVVEPSIRLVDPGNYPFLHTINGSQDVLSPYFNKAGQPPSIVILLVEGLGRAFTNRGAYLGNWTPFIDSLSQHSLYWENFLSEGGRTFAVLPSLLGSLPFGKNGFNELGDNMPKHLSLLSLLKYNGYSTHFYYGGDSHFDNLNLYMTKNNITSINDLNNCPSGYVKMPASSAGFSWGYGDKELFRRYLSTKSSSGGPSVNVLLTLSTHSPFLVNDQDYYLKKVEQRMNELRFDEGKKNEARNYKYNYASILYTDDAIRYFINEYKKRPDFNNTVFIITGDHRMPEIPMSTKIDRYHVPFIIYSPLLKKTATFQSISTHFDVTPTLLMWLRNSYGIKLPTMAHWIGDGIDASASFRNIHSYPLMQTKNTLIDFIMGMYMLNDDKLFKIGNNMDLEPQQDEAKMHQLEGSFNMFKRKNDKFISGTKLVPDSIINKYLPK